MGRHKKPIEVELTEDEMKLPVKGGITKLSGRYIVHFSEDSYEHSLKSAYEWAKKYNQRNDVSHKIVLKDYFKQTMGNKAILVSYDLVSKKDLEKEESQSVIVD